jgi:hypothetical protein
MGSMALSAFSAVLPNLNERHSFVPDMQQGAVSRTENPAGERDTPQLLGQHANKTAVKNDEAAFYHAQFERIAFSMRLQEVAAQLAQNGANSANNEAEGAVTDRQLTFDFFAESRTEELVLFSQRSREVADGLESTQKSTYLEVSRQVATRFKMSATLSGESLAGFNNAAEELGGAREIFEKFMALATGLLKQTEEMFNEFFSAFSGTHSVKAGSFSEKMQHFLEAFLGDLFGQGTGAQALQAKGFQINIQLEFSFSFSASISVQEGVVMESDPIILDLNDDGFNLTSYKNGARFDILGSGQPVTTAFVTGGDAFLAMDRNGDGIINDGTELFGDQRGAANGFEELRKLDSNGDGIINRLDRDFDKLLLFRDNGNGITEPGELLTLAEAGIAEIRLGYTNVNQRTSGGNRIAQIASYVRTDGTLGRAGDAILNYVV